MSGPREVLLANLPLIEQIISSICRRKGMNPDDIEEFSSVVKLRLIENDYAIIRAFKERSSFATYIAAVISRNVLDHRNREWGKWRVSAEAQRLGEIAVKLERMLHREERSFDEACAAVLAEHPDVSRVDLERILAKLPRRMKRRRVELNETELEPTPADDTAPERENVASRISVVVRAFIDQLSDEDQLILRLRFDSDMSVAQIARALHLDQQVLYRRLYGKFTTLRKRLEAAGVSADDVTSLIGHDTEFLDFQLKSRGRRPSEEDESYGGDPAGGTRHDR